MGVVEAILAAERRCGGERVSLREPCKILARAFRPVSAADDDEGAPRVCEQRLQRGDRIVRNPGRDRRVRIGIRDGGLLDQHVFGQRDRYRAGPSRACTMERLAHELRDPPRIVDLDDPLAQRVEKPPVLDLLERLAIRVSARHLPDEQHHRSRILGRVVEADGRMAGARTSGDHDHAGSTGELAVGLRHVGGTAFVPAGDRRDCGARVVQGVEGGEVALSRHAEDGVDAVNPEGVDQDPGAGAPTVLLHVHPRARASRRGADSRTQRANRGMEFGTAAPMVRINPVARASLPQATQRLQSRARQTVAPLAVDGI